MAAATALIAPRIAWISLLLIALPLVRRWPAARVLVGVGLGAVVAGLRPPAAAIEQLELHRPVTVEARVQSTPWVDERGQRRCWIRLLRLGQDDLRLRSEQEAHLRVAALGSETVRRGATLRIRGYLGRSPPVRNGRGERPGPWRLSVPSPRFVEFESPPSPWLRGVGRLRHVLAGVLERWPDQDAAALVATLWLGERSRLPERWQRALRAWGLAHLTAVSGLHVGAVAVMLWAVGAFLPRSPRLFLVLAGVVTYAALVGPRPSVARASLMALVAVGALVLERPPAALNALSVAVAVMVFHHPPVIADLGFQLSAAATAGLLALTVPIARLLSGNERPGPWSLALASSLAAQLAVLPIAAPTFALVHPGTAPVQLVALPWLFLALLGGAGALALSLAWPAFDGSLLLRPLVSCLEVLSDLPAGAWVTWPTSIAPHLALALTAMLVAIVVFGRGRRSSLALAAVLLAGVGACQQGPRPAPQDEASVTAIDVGQGDALLLRSRGVSILVDGGGWRRGDSASRILLPALAELRVRRLDAVVLSHADADHCDGLRDLASYLQIGEVWSAAGWAEPCAGELIGRRGPLLRALWRGRSLSRGDWHFDTLWPPAGRRRAGGNARSLVLRATAMDRAVLLTGDLDAAAERELLSRPPARRTGSWLRSDVLKVAHHGSKSSTTPAFLAAASPAVALIQAGRGNAYGHPHPSVTGRLRERKIHVLRTDRHGRIELRWRRGGPIRSRVAAAGE